MDKVLKRIKPSRFESYLIDKIAQQFVNKLKTEHTTPVLGGSTAKGTWLRGDHDVDVFVKFKSEKDISDKLEKLLKEKFSNIQRIHGSRDYFQIRRLFLKFEIIPILDIKTTKEAKNITDCSPFHVEWIRNHSDEKIRDEIRLLKQFCKAQKIYGAETHIKGFSGHVADLLVIYYKSFHNVIKAATKWKEGTVIKFENKIPKLNESKLSPLIIIDPTEPNRNAAAALSKEKFNRFIEVCKEYLKNPKEDFFKIKPLELKHIKHKDTIVKILPKEGKKDIVATKMLKCYEYLVKELEKYGFKIEESDFIFNDKKPSLIYFEFKTKTLPKTYKHYGPPTNKKSNVKIFQEKHKNIFKEKGKVYTILERKHTNAKDYLKELLNSNYIKEKVKQISLIK